MHVKGMTVISFKQFLEESVNDKGAFKAIFVIGIPGAGKSYTVSKLMGTVAPKIVNTDRAAEFLASKWGTRVSAETWGGFQDKAHRITAESLKHYLNGMLPLFIDGTSNNVSNLLHRMGILESLGYDVGVINVITPVETAIKRAKARALKGNRDVDEDFIREVAKTNTENAEYLRSKVDFFKELNNAHDVLDNAQMMAAFKACQGFFGRAVRNPIGKRTLETLSDHDEVYLMPTVVSEDMLDKKVEGWYRT